jgi:LmbE family N-acetylglucosaminyl deacetylase
MWKSTIRFSVACALAAPAMFGSVALAAHADDGPRPETILAILAHPDDELVFAPALAAKLRGGASVQIVYATRGDAGPGVSSFARGEELARARSLEAECASAALGLRAPVLLDFGDGTLNQHVRGDSANAPKNLRASVVKILEDVRPDLVISWGPDGGYGHADHRLVSAIVTELVQAKPVSERPMLIYPGIAAGTLPPIPELQIWAVTSPELLDHKIAYTADDLAKAQAATQCHKTQFDEATRAGLMPVFDQSIWKGAVHFRTAFPSKNAQ